MAKVKPTEKTLEQFFSEKLAAIHKEDKPVVKTRKDIFSDEHTSVTRESLDYTKYLNELSSRVSKNKKSEQSTIFSEFKVKLFLGSKLKIVFGKTKPLDASDP